MFLSLSNMKHSSVNNKCVLRSKRIGKGDEHPRKPAYISTNVFTFIVILIERLAMVMLLIWKVKE